MWLNVVNLWIFTAVLLTLLAFPIFPLLFKIANWEDICELLVFIFGWCSGKMLFIECWCSSIRPVQRPHTKSNEKIDSTFEIPFSLRFPLKTLCLCSNSSLKLCCLSSLKLTLEIKLLLAVWLCSSFSEILHFGSLFKFLEFYFRVDCTNRMWYLLYDYFHVQS